MHEHIKKRIVNNLIGEIEFLDPVGLEIVGNNLIALMEGQKMIHHGINKDYKPCGYTVDSFSDDSCIVGEYSTDKDYFKADKEGVFKKIQNDIDHAVQHTKPSYPQKIYLLTSQVEPPSFRSKFNETSIFKKHGGIIYIYDSRRIGEEIYSLSIDTPESASFFRDFFPGFLQDLDNYAYYGRVPAACDGFISDGNVLDSIRQHYQKGLNLCVLHGLSGSGKTQSAIDFIHQDSPNFDNYLWISGDDWPADTPLSAIERTRGGSLINIAGLFNSYSTILVIDNLNREIDEAQFSELVSGFDKGGVVLVTSQLASAKSQLYLSIPSVSEVSAFQILDEDPTSATEKCKDFVNLCAPLPILLSTARKIIKMEGIDKDQFYQEVIDSPGIMFGDNGEPIMRNILARLNKETLQQLKIISNSESTFHDINFLRWYIGINACVNLQRLSILMQANIPDVFKIHDLVAFATKDSDEGSQLASGVEQYIESKHGEMSPSVIRQIHLSFDQLIEEHLHRGDRNPDWITYALLQVDREIKSEIHQSIFETPITTEMSLASLMCVIDAREVHSYTIKDNDERKKYYEACSVEYRDALDKSQNEVFIAELMHHLGKTLRRSDHADEALDIFEKLLDLRPEWHATYGQIAHLGTQKGISSDINGKGNDALRKLLDAMLQDANKVPLRVSLAAIARLRSYPTLVNELSSSSEAVQKIADIIAMSALEGFGQFYEAFVSFTSKFGYLHPLESIRLIEELLDLQALLPEIVEKKQWTSACEALTNTAMAAKRKGLDEQFSRISEASVRFAIEIDSIESIKPYDARAVAKCFITANRPDQALLTIDKLSSDDVNHWVLYQKSKALIATKKYQLALDEAKAALNLALEDPNAKNNIASYHDLMSECYELLEDNESAIEEVKTALQKCTTDKYSRQLEERLKDLQKVL